MHKISNNLSSLYVNLFTKNSTHISLEVSLQTDVFGWRTILFFHIRFAEINRKIFLRNGTAENKMNV